MMAKVSLGTLPTGIAGLDTLLNGGISAYSFNVITGAPGSGKTTLAHQMMFALANPQRKALYFTIIGEPPLKMLRYQQQYAFFDIDRVGSSIKYLNLADDLQSGRFEGVLDRILKEVEDFQPELVFVDSFKSVVHAMAGGEKGLADLQNFIQRLGMYMASWQATTFLIGEYADAGQEGNPIFTVADGVIHLLQETDQNAVVRKIRVVKMRGKSHMLGAHSFRITDHGLQVFPRQLSGGLAGDGDAAAPAPSVPPNRLSTGSDELDAMLGGGIPEGYSMLVLGPPGCGKTVLGTAFLAAGVRNGEVGMAASFEHILSVAANAPLERMIADGKVVAIRSQALDLSIEELVSELVETARRTGARRLLIDSLSALELSLAPQFRTNFQESLFRMLSALHHMGVTVMMTRNVMDVSSNHLSPSAFLVDGVISMRYIERDSRIIKAIASPKLRGSWHSNQIRPYTVQEDGITVSPTELTP